MVRGENDRRRRSRPHEAKTSNLTEDCAPTVENRPSVKITFAAFPSGEFLNCSVGYIATHDTNLIRDDNKEG